MDTLKTQRRDIADKAKKLRREGFVVGSLFGKEIKDSLLFKVDKLELAKFLRTNNKGSKVTLDIDGEKHLALIKSIDYDPFKGVINEISLQELLKDEVVKSVAEIVIENRDKVQSGVLQEDLTEVSYSALPADLVDKITIDASKLKFGEVIKVKDLDICKNPKLTVHTNPEAIILSVSASSIKEEDSTEETEASTTGVAQINK